MFIFVPEFYRNSEQILSVVKGLPLVCSRHGKEIENFNMVAPEVVDAFGMLLSNRVLALEPSGLFRVPYPVIHFDDFDRASFFHAAIALEEGLFKTYRHKETGFSTVVDVGDNFDKFVSENCFDESKWDIAAQVLMKPNDLILYKPFLWHSFSSTYMKFFYLARADA
jgi:hypothetical protein